MDVDGISSSSKDQKLCGIDIISNLPEFVLNYIISFLSTREAIQLSVLSKRWKYLWTSIPIIDLEDETNWNMEFRNRIPNLSEAVLNLMPECPDLIQQTEPNTNFLEFVDRVVTLHDASDIQRLRLQLSVPETYPNVRLWIQVAINHNVKELDLMLRHKLQDALPSCFFTCCSLVVLRISAQLAFNPPPSTSFLNLKNLRLCRVTFLDVLSSQQLFSGCPVLEELAMIDCNLKHQQNLTIFIPTLKRLTIEFVSGVMVNILSINLTHLTYSSGGLPYVCMGELPSLDNASINIHYPHRPIDGFAYRVRSVFSGIYNVKALKITNQVLKSIIHVSDILDHIPTFYNLIHLEVSHVDCPCYNDLMKFLIKTPRLERLDLFQVYETVEMVPSCFSSLKLVTMFYSGTLAELELIGFILAKAIGLQRLILYPITILPRYSELVRVLPKVSESCVIEFRDSMP